MNEDQSKSCDSVNKIHGYIIYLSNLKIYTAVSYVV